MTFLKRLAREKRLNAAFTEPVITTQKMRGRVDEGLVEADDLLVKLATTEQAAKLRAFLSQQRTAATTFSNAKRAATTALLTEQRTALLQALSNIDTMLQIVASIVGAKGSLGDACIRAELDKLTAAQRQKEDDLCVQQATDTEILKLLTDASEEISKQQQEEFLKQIARIRDLRELLHSLIQRHKHLHHSAHENLQQKQELLQKENPKNNI